MNILVTGGAGFLGSHIAEKLMKRGDCVIIMDSMQPESARRKKNLTELSSLGRFYFHEADVSDARAVMKIFKEKRIDCVCHFQGEDGGDSFQYSIEAYQRCLSGMLNICETSVRMKTGALLFASSPSVYEGAPKKRGHFPEEAVSENPETLKVLPYRSIEQVAYAYHKQYGLQCAGFRIFPTYGPRSGHGNPLNGILDAGMSGRVVEVSKKLLEREADWTYIEDIADGITAAIDKEFGYEIFNLGSGVPMSMAEFIDKAEIALGRKISLKFSKGGTEQMESIMPDIGKAKRLIAYSLKVPMREGIKRYIEWHKQKNNGRALSQSKYF